MYGIPHSFILVYDTCFPSGFFLILNGVNEEAWLLTDTQTAWCRVSLFPFHGMAEIADPAGCDLIKTR